MKHLAIIPDGNRRWARREDLPKRKGHRKGLEKIKKTVGWCLEKDLKHLTFYVFSTENWNRDKKEVDYLMGLFEKELKGELIEQLKEKNVKVSVLGKRKDLPKNVKSAVTDITEKTSSASGMRLNLCLNYGGRLEIIEGVKEMVAKNKEITSQNLEDSIWSGDLPDIDLLIRTGKEKRISNFLLWKLAYSELYFSDCFWPDFKKEELERALEDYQTRERRWGR